MSEIKTWPVATTVVRQKDNNTGGQGCGNSKRMIVGRSGGAGTARNYDTFIKPTGTLWTDVGKIVSLTLVSYSDVSRASESPAVLVTRLGDSFTEGNNADGVFDASDFTVAAALAAGRTTVHPSKAVDGLNRWDVTPYAEAWAPTTVKQRNGKPGGKAAVYGVGLFGTAKTTEDWSGYSEEATNPSVRPYFELVYERGATKPNTPTNLSPSGAVGSIDAFEADFSDVRATDQLRRSEVQVFKGTAIQTGQTVNQDPIWSISNAASDTEILNDRSNVVPTNLVLAVLVSYQWRIRHTDQEGQVSDWTDLTPVNLTNTVPSAPVITPVSGSSFASLNGVIFGGGPFVDANGDKLLAFQCQLSAYPEGDAHWLDSDVLRWDTGKVFVALDSTEWFTPYGGDGLETGTFYLRARHWDDNDGVSAWRYATIILTADFDTDLGTQDSVQIDPLAPWRIVIRAMHTNGKRGPGAVVAILEDSKNTGAATVYNSPGGMHFTVLKDHPQISVIEPKQTHYAVEFYTGDGWRETFAGVVWDVDATEKDVVFQGIDYLGLLDYVQDERYDPANPDKTSTKGGSKYVDQTITAVITDQLTRATKVTNSPVGFITVGSIAAMNEKVTIFSTMENGLSFVVGLLDSHKQGSGKKTRIRVKKTTAGAYQFVIVDNPGQTRDNLRLSYGELVQGYRVIPFGNDWFSHINMIGRTRDGLRIYYKGGTEGDAPGINPATYGRISTAQLIDGALDENDLLRRQKQAAIHAGKLGKSIGLGIRTGFLKPFDGYDICDAFPVAIDDGAINTDAFGSGYWVCFAVAWEASDDGNQNIVLTLLPREDTTAPDADLIPTRPISPQAEWQLGWTPPSPVKASSKYWLDQNTGKVYIRDDDTFTPISITGTA